MYENSDRYLALALASRKALRSLNQYVKQGTVDAQLQNIFDQVVESLKATKNDNNLFGLMPTESPFTNYEQVQTLEEVENEHKEIDIVSKLSQPLASYPDEKQRRSEAGPVIEFFYMLENRALHLYSSQIGSREL
jgi:hypothetical protein